MRRVRAQFSAGGLAVSAPPFAVADVGGTTLTAVGAAGVRIERTGNADWDASANGQTPLTGNFLLRFQPQSSGVGNDMMVGVTTDPDASRHYNTIDYAFYFNGGTGVDIYENGLSPFSGGTTYGPGDNFFAKRVGTALTFYKGADADGTVGEAMTAYTEAGTLYFDSSFASVAGKTVTVTRLA